MSAWFVEEEKNLLKYGYAYDKKLFSSQSKYQSVQVVNTLAYGKMLILDDFVMLTESDEFVYHELIAHIPMLLHNSAKKVVVIGGGDGGTIRELLKHDSIEEIILCEIDGMVIDVCKKYFPKVAGELDHNKVSVKILDGVEYIKTLDHCTDLIIVDSTDPIGPGEGLFTKDFYKSVYKALKVAQSESPWADAKFLNRIHQNIAGGGFSTIKPYIGSVPTYPRGLWSWTLASKSEIDFNEQIEKIPTEKISSDLKYLTKDILKNIFNLPKFYKDKLNYVN